MTRPAHYVALTFRITKDHGQFSAICEELGTASCGDTIDEAVKNIREAVLVDLNTLEKLGERARFFKERGIRMYPAPRKVAKRPPSIRFGDFVTTQNIRIPA